LARLFNEPTGREYLISYGVEENIVNNLDLVGFSGIANILSAIKFAKYYELGPKDVVLTVLTDSMELYQSRLREMHSQFGTYSLNDAAANHARYLLGTTTDNILELGYPDRKRVHNLKYYTWVEQQGKTYQEIQEQWYDDSYWVDIQKQVNGIDDLITEFNQDTGLL
jgi:hypothetical protein